MYQFRFVRPAIFIAAVIFLQSCASSTAGLAVSSIPLENREYEVLGPAESNRGWLTFDIGILGFPLETPPIDKAMEDLLKDKGGDALINIRYHTEKWVFPFITYNRFFIKADVVKTAPLVKPAPVQQPPRRR